MIDVISPQIRQFHETVPTINSFEINIKSIFDFDLFIKICDFNEYELSSKKIEVLRVMMYKLGNMNEDKKLILSLNKEVKYDNVFERIEIKTLLSLSFDEEASFISIKNYYFYQNSHEKLINLKCCILELIFSKSKFKVISEDILFKFILELYEKSTKYSALFGIVVLVNLTKEAMKDLLTMLPKKPES